MVPAEKVLQEDGIHHNHGYIWYNFQENPTHLRIGW